MMPDKPAHLPPGTYRNVNGTQATYSVRLNSLINLYQALGGGWRQ